MANSKRVKRIRICQVNGCANPVHAKAYCRKHYGQIWRKGEITTDGSWGSQRESYVRADDRERLRALERELKKAERMYNMVVGFEGRTRWRREITAVRTEIDRIQLAVSAGKS